MTAGIGDIQWSHLLSNIDSQRCTPFIGPETYSPYVQSSLRDTVSRWTSSFGYPLVFEEFNTFYNSAKEKYGYPLEDSYQLAKVAQFLAIVKGEGDDMLPKNILGDEMKDVKPPNFSLDEFRNKPYAVLADLNLPVYITTNYDYFMEAALESNSKNPVSDFCRWNEGLYNLTDSSGIPSVLDKKNNVISGNIDLKYRPKKQRYKPSPAEPLVYHLHGIYEIPQSMVLTEKDYLDFAINLNKNDEKISLPPEIRTRLSGSLLFVGYRLEDITFRVIFQGVISIIGENIQRPFSVTVQLPPRMQVNAQTYLEQYTRKMYKTFVGWSDLDAFAEELREKWNDFKRKKGEH